MSTVGMMTTAQIKARVAEMEASGLVTVTADWKAGTVVGIETDFGKKVFSALQKGHNQPWIVRHSNGMNVKWSDSNNTSPSSTTPG